MTDDLRTRAREAAEGRFADLVVDSAPVYTRQSVRYYQQGAFIDGALWHAARPVGARTIFDGTTSRAAP